MTTDFDQQSEQSEASLKISVWSSLFTIFEAGVSRRRLNRLIGMSTPSGAAENDLSAHAGQAIYTPFFLAHVYDPLVIRFANRFTWRCTSRTILDLYDSHVSDDHLDAGPGTGWYLRNCRFPGENPRIALIDINSDVLSEAARRLARHCPERYCANILEPIDLAGRKFDSVGLVHVLHCLPGTMLEKAMVFDHLRPLIRLGGTLFGTTILSGGVPQTRLARSQLKRMNQLRVFDNEQDSLHELDRTLSERFANYTLRTAGSVALFTAIR